MNKQQHAPKPQPPIVTLADRFLSTTQRLRADETVTATTVGLRYAAAWAQSRKAVQR